MLVPSLPPTNFSADVCGCRYMFVVCEKKDFSDDENKIYKILLSIFEVTARTAACHQNPTFEIPVVVGTYPISNELYSSSMDGNETSQTTFLSTAPPLGEYLSASNTNINSSDLPPYPDAGS